MVLGPPKKTNEFWEKKASESKEEMHNTNKGWCLHINTMVILEPKD